MPIWYPLLYLFQQWTFFHKIKFFISLIYLSVTEYQYYILGFFPSLFNSPRSLKCLSSHVVKKEIPKAVYSHQLPVTLKDFVAFH